MTTKAAQHRTFKQLANPRRGENYAVYATIYAATAALCSAARAFYDEHNTPKHQTTDARIERAREMCQRFDAEARHELVTPAMAATS